MTVREIADVLSGRVEGPAETDILTVAKIEEAGPGSITFLANPKYERFLATTKASAVLVAAASDRPRTARADMSLIVVSDPYTSFLRILKLLAPPPDPFYRGIHPTAVVGPGAVVAPGASIGPFSVVADGARVGAGTVLGAHVTVGRGAEIGGDCTIYDNVVIYHGCKVGDRTIIHGGAVIGADGFGFAPRPDGSYEKIPQTGIVRIESDCEIGANSTIDRATMGETVLRTGVKLDNLVQIAHNCVIGEHTVIAAQTGVSGSTKIGPYCRIAGQVGISGHVEIAERTTLLGQTGVSKNITEPGRTWFGTPQREHVRSGRIEAIIRTLPELRAEVDALRKAVDELRQSLSS